MSSTKHIERVAIIGAGGRIGGSFVEELLKSGKHTVTAITRADSESQLPSGVKIAKVDYDNDESLASALKGQQFLAITLSVFAPPELHSKIVKAAVKAGVPYIMPNAYGADSENRELAKDQEHLERSLAYCDEVKELGASYICMCCGFWYEWSLALGEQWFGFDIKNRKVTFFDDGKTKIDTSTWQQCGRAFAGLLSLPESGSAPAIEQWKNKSLYLASFKVSQRDMLDSLNRVLGTSDKDWEIKHENTKQRYQEGLDEFKKGIFTGRAKAMYSRAFFPDGSGEFESKRGLVNGILELPKENLDDSTKKAVEMVESGWNPFGR